jgi:hypothetical protein
VGKAASVREMCPLMGDNIFIVAVRVETAAHLQWPFNECDADLKTSANITL